MQLAGMSRQQLTGTRLHEDQVRVLKDWSPVWYHWKVLWVISGEDGVGEEVALSTLQYGLSSRAFFLRPTWFCQ